jgi:hypothetical protein
LIDLVDAFDPPLIADEIGAVAQVRTIDGCHEALENAVAITRNDYGSVIA